METPTFIRNAVNRFKRWREPEPLEPTEAQVAAARRLVEAATAQIVDAYDHTATTFAVRDRGQDYLITNAHLTTNFHDASRGFAYKGKQYFLIAKGHKIAFAEHIAVNPQGGPCDTAKVDGRFDPNQPFYDLSILRAVSPAETRNMLYNLSFDVRTRVTLEKALSHIPGIGQPLQDAQFSGEELINLTQGFPLIPLIIERKEYQSKRTPSGYSIGFQNNRPEFARSSDSLNRTQAKGIMLDIDPREPIIQGHSGSLRFDVSQTGTLSLLAVNTGITKDCKNAFAVPFSAVLEGLDAIRRNPNLPRAELAKICATTIAHQDRWYAGSDITPGPAMARASAPAASNVCRRP